MRNTGWLFSYQISTYVAHLAIIPFLTRVLPVSEYGAVMAVMAATQLAFTLTDYGFSVSATYEVSLNRNQAGRVQQIIADVHGAKVLLVASALLALFIVSCLPTYRPYPSLFLFAGLTVVGQAYQPVWLFQGLEHMKAYAFYMVAVRLAFMLSVFMLVQQAGDGVWVLVSLALANGLGMGIGLYTMRRLGYHPLGMSLRGGLKVLRDTAGYFWGRLAFAAYTSANAIVIGAAGLAQAGLYTAVEQIYKAGQSVGGPVSQALYPALANSRDVRLLWKIAPTMTGIMIAGCGVIAWFAPEIVQLAFGASYAPAVPVLYVFLATVPVSTLGMVLGYPLFAALGRPNIANHTLVAAGLVHIVLLGSIWIIGALSAYNVALCVLCTESFMLLLRIILGHITYRRVQLAPHDLSH